jgi:hypothetical protein
MKKLIFTYCFPGADCITTIEDENFVVPLGALLVGAVPDDTPNPMLEAAVAKLVNLGLTEDEAQAVSGN